MELEIEKRKLEDHLKNLKHQLTSNTTKMNSYEKSNDKLRNQIT